MYERPAGLITPRVSSNTTRQALTRCHCFIASDLDPFPPETSPTFPRVAFGTAAAVRCTRHLPAKVVCNDAAGRSFLFTSCRHLSARNRNRLPVASSLSTSRDAYAAADGVRGACIPSSVAYSETPDAHPVLTICHFIRVKSLYPIPRDRRRRPCGTLTQPLLECIVLVPPATIVVCTDPVGHSLSVSSL